VVSRPRVADLRAGLRVRFAQYRPDKGALRASDSGRVAELRS
jgi:hypothetical protein